jgi:hypothetical protein
LHASAVAKELRWFVRQDAGTLEAFPEPCLALEVTGRERVLPTAFGELLLVVEQVRLVDRDAAFAPSRLAARLDDPAGIVRFAGAMCGSDLDARRARLSLLAPTERDTDHRHQAE